MSEERAPDSDPLGSPDEGRGGPNVDAAVENAEAGSQVEGVHTPVGQAESGESRLERMTEVDLSGESEDRDPSTPDTPPRPDPSPAEVGSGGSRFGRDQDNEPRT